MSCQRPLLILLGLAAVVVTVPLRLIASDYCPTEAEAVGEIASQVRSVTETLDNRTEFGGFVYRDNQGCYRTTDVIQGEDKEMTSSDVDEGYNQAAARGTPTVYVHSHNHTDTNNAGYGLSDDDKGIAEDINGKVIAIDTGDANCAYGYDATTDQERSRCQ